MYFSKHNKDITYINHYSGLLEVEGAGVLCREDAELSPRPTENLAEEYDTLSITEGITEVGEGFLDAFPYIDCLILSHTVVNVVVSDATIEWMQNNEVLIRGEYDTFAERFARENSLAFLHSDIPLAEYDLDVYPEHDIVTLRFFLDDQLITVSPPVAPAAAMAVERLSINCLKIFMLAALSRCLRQIALSRRRSRYCPMKHYGDF